MCNNDVQETLFFPLLGRARAARTWPTCFKDPWSERVVALAEADRPDIQNKDMGEMPAAIYALRHLTHLTLPHQSQPKIDLAQFPQLRELSCAGKGNAHNLSQAASLQRLYLFSFKDKDLSALGSLKNLQQLTLIQPAIETLNGLTELLQLETLDIAYARKLHDISALQQCPWLKSVALPAKFQG